MELFFPSTRTDVQREIAVMDEKGYLLDKRTYLMIRFIEVETPKGLNRLEIKVNNNDVRFYLTLLNTTLYLSTYDIYETLAKFENKDKLLKVLKSNRQTEYGFIYESVQYKYYFFDEIDSSLLSETCYVPKIDQSINVIELLALLALIQDKSNYLFRKQPKYIDGLIRLLIALLCRNTNHFILQQRGWEYDEYAHRFRFRKPTESLNKSYYLTKDEFSDIMKEP